METNRPASRMHPLIIVAAISVIAVALAGVGVLTGILPTPGDRAAEPALTSVTEADTSIAQEPVTSKPVEPAQPTKSASTPSVTKKAAKPAKAAVSPAPTSIATKAPVKCHDCGVVEEVRILTVTPEGSGLGGVAGGVVGGLLGNQVGKGSGRTAATVAGVVGGALVGNQIEKSTKKTQSYELVVRYDDGTTQVFPSDTLPAWREGDQVRVVNGVLTSR